MKDKYIKIIDLGMQPFADTFIGRQQLNLSEPLYPLECFLNKDSGEIRVGVNTKEDDRYNLYDYSYTSSNSKFSKSHWTKYASEVSDKINLSNNSSIVEIGSNDGFLSKLFKDMGHDIAGVDPSRYMAQIAKNTRGINTYNCLFSYNSSQEIKNDRGACDLVIANNVFNHSNDPDDFIRGVSNLLSPEGFFVFELPYWYNTIKDRKFDQIYHEHVTYFTVKYSYNLLKLAGFEIVDVEVVDYHGGSIRVYAKKLSSPKAVGKNNIVAALIRQEEEFGLFDSETYVEFMNEITRCRDRFLSRLYSIRSQNIPIIAVGASAKGNTFLNFYNLDCSVLDYVTDASIHKQGKYTPLTRIPITGDEIFKNYDKAYALILSWNISDIIKEKLKQINCNIEFLSLGEE